MFTNIFVCGGGDSEAEIITAEFITAEIQRNEWDPSLLPHIHTSRLNSSVYNMDIQFDHNRHIR